MGGIIGTVMWRFGGLCCRGKNSVREAGRPHQGFINMWSGVIEAVLGARWDHLGCKRALSSTARRQHFGSVVERLPRATNMSFWAVVMSSHICPIEAAHG